MKFTKSQLKQIIKEEANFYLDEMVDNMDLEYEDEGLEDEDYLLSMLSREFDRIPVERRKSVYTRFLSAANKYADQVNPSTTPMAAAALEEQLINSLTALKVLNEVSIMNLAKMLAKNPKARNTLVAALMSMGVSMSSGDAQAGGTATSDFAQAQQSQTYKGYQPGGTETFKFGAESKEDELSQASEKLAGWKKTVEMGDALIIKVDEQSTDKLQLVSNALEYDGSIEFDGLELKKYLMKKGGKLDKSGQFRYYVVPKKGLGEKCSTCDAFMRSGNTLKEE